MLMDIAPLQYNHVDPTEFQLLKDELETLKTEKSATESQQTAQVEELIQLQEKVCFHSSQIYGSDCFFLRSDRCIGEDEQGAQRGYHEEYPDLQTTYGCPRCREHAAQVEPQRSTESVCCDHGVSAMLSRHHQPGPAATATAEPTTSTEPQPQLTEEHERLRQEKATLEQVLQRRRRSSP